jgi:HEAT repeat protein
VNLRWPLLVLSVLLSAPLSAQERQTRFERKFDDVGSRGTRVVLDRAPESNSWDARLVDARTRKTLAEASMPEWAGADYYTYQASTVTIGSSFVVILEAVPGPDAPSIAASFQVAFARGSKQTAWKQVATTRFSELDGGERLVVRVRDNRADLVKSATGPSTFCGARTATQVFDPDQVGFRTGLDIDELVAKASPVAALLPVEPFQDDTLPGFSLWFLATSDRLNTDDSRTVIRPIELGDGKLNSIWVEGRPGNGNGEFVTARINPSLKLRGFRIFPGNGANIEEFKSHARPTRILVSTEESTMVVSLPNTPFDPLKAVGGFFVRFPESVRTRCLTVALLDSVSGSASGDDAWKAHATAISEITPVSELYGLPSEFAAVVVVEKLLKEGDNRNTRRLATLTSPLGKELGVILDRVVTGGSDEDRARVAPLLVNLPSDEAVPILIDLFEKGSPESSFYVPVRRGLEMHRDVAGPQLIRYLRDSPPEDARKHSDLLRMVGRLAEPDDLRFLTASLGEGDMRIRKERVRAIARAGRTVLGDLFAVMRVKPETDAAEDALRAVSIIGRKVFQAAPGVVDGADILATLALSSKSSRTRMVVIRTLEYFKIAEDESVLINLTQRDLNPLVRRAAIHSLAPRDTREARIALESALSDDSPDVRIAAAEAIGRRQDGGSSVPALKVYTANETWPRGLNAGYVVLVTHGNEKDQDFLEREILRAPHSTRAEVIADALKRGERGISSAVGRQLLQDDEVSFMLKRHVVDSLGVQSLPANELLLLEIIGKPQPFPEFEDSRNVNLQVRALLALGRMRTDSSRDFLLERLGSVNDLNWQQAYLRALSFSTDSVAADRLEEFLKRAPESLHDDITAAVGTIRRRASVKGIVESIDDTLED